MSELPDFDLLWNYDDPSATEAEFLRLVPLFLESGDTGKYVELQTQIARTHSLRGKFDEAHAVLDGVVDRLGTCGPRGNIRYLLERGRALNSAGQPGPSYPLFEEAWDIGVAAGEDRLAVDAAHMLAIVAPPEGRLAWTEKGLDLVERTSDPAARNWRGPLYNNIGWSYLEASRCEEALAAFQKGLEFRLEKGVVKPIRIAKYAVGRALRSLGRIEEALALQKALREEWAADEIKPPYVNEEIGECLLLRGAPSAESAPFFARAYEEISKDSWMVAHETERLARLRALGGAKEHK